MTLGEAYVIPSDGLGKAGYKTERNINLVHFYDSEKSLPHFPHFE
jgi:hypothetical protein